jgi:hypothetical protein
MWCMDGFCQHVIRCTTNLRACGTILCVDGTVTDRLVIVCNRRGVVGCVLYSLGIMGS